MALPLLAGATKMIAGGSKAKAATKLLGDGKEKAKKVSRQKLLPGSKEDNSLPGSKKSKPSSSLIKRPRLSITKIKPVKPSTQKEGTFDMDKLDDLLKSLVENTESLKKITKKDVKDEKKKSENKDRVKQKVKVKRREEKTEAVKEGKDVEKKSGISLPKTPDFLKGIFESIGRLTLSVGIMTLLNVLTDPEKRESIFNFLSENIDKIVLGMLGIIAISFATSFLPVIGMVGALLSIMLPIVTGLGAIILNPVVLTVLGLIAGGMALREILNKLEGPTREFYEKKVQPGINRAQYGDRAAEGQFIRDLRDNYGRISTKADRDKLTDEEKDTARFLKIYEEKLKELAALQRQLRGTRGPNNNRKIQERITATEQILDGISSQLRIGGKSLSELRERYDADGSLPQTSIQRQSQPTLTPQTEVIPQTEALPQETSGNVVEYLTGDRSHSGYRADHGGSNYHEHLAFSSTEERDSAIELLKSKGIVIGSMNDGRHARDSYHYTDQAFDVPLYPNIQNFGIPDNKQGEEKFSAMVRKILYEGGFKGKGMGEGLQPTIREQPRQDSAQKVSYQTEYERSGVQVAMVQVPVPTPIETPVSVGGGGGSSSSSGSSVNTYSDLFLASRYSEA